MPIRDSLFERIDAVDLAAGVHTGRQCVRNELLERGRVLDARVRLMQQRVRRREPNAHPDPVELDPSATGSGARRRFEQQAADITAVPRAGLDRHDPVVQRDAAPRQLVRRRSRDRAGRRAQIQHCGQLNAVRETIQRGRITLGVGG